MNNPFQYIPDHRCNLTFQKMHFYINRIKRSKNPDDMNFCNELEAGKMLGVLIASDNSGMEHTLCAFSGQLGKRGFHFPGFVDGVFDYLQPSGYFKKKEKEIIVLNNRIAILENSLLPEIKKEYELYHSILDKELEAYKIKFRKAKAQRKALREAKDLNEADEAELQRQSQFEKAELRRIKKRIEVRLLPYSQKLDEINTLIADLKSQRRIKSEALQNWLFANFKVLNAKGESKSLSDIFADTPLKIPPSGAGECCAPKLLQAAYLKGWRPVAIAEYWYGKSKDGETRIHGRHYPACRGKCRPILQWMLQGLDVNPSLEHDSFAEAIGNPLLIFENQFFCIVDKPSGWLSIRGKGSTPSIEEWLTQKFGSERKVKMAHRLDQDTSGLLIATFGDAAYKIMQSLFATHRVKKTYMARLEGNYIKKGASKRGEITLPLSPDWLDRPRQRVDPANGKAATTKYEFIEVTDNHSSVLFYPLTGRTHQLRVHAASSSGLGMPIIGDRLYGHYYPECNQRLQLHAFRLEFTYPSDGVCYHFESPLKLFHIPF